MKIKDLKKIMNVDDNKKIFIHSFYNRDLAIAYSCWDDFFNDSSCDELEMDASDSWCISVCSHVVVIWAL